MLKIAISIFFIEHIKDVTKRALPKTRTTVGNFIEGENFFGEYLEALSLNLDYFLSDAISYQDYKEFFFSKFFVPNSILSLPSKTFSKRMPM